MDDLFLMYAAHTQELDDAVDRIIDGEEVDFSFELTDYDYNYLTMEINKKLGL